MIGIILMIKLLSLVCGEYQEMKLIAELNNFFEFDHNIFLLDATVDIDRCLNRTELIPKILLSVEGEQNMSRLLILSKLTNKNSLMIFVAETGELNKNLNLLHRLKKIQTLQRNMKIGMFFKRSSSRDLRELFEWCKIELIINIFAATYLNEIRTSDLNSLLNVFTFSPFGRFQLINVTNAPYECYFASSTSNFQQHQLKLGDSFDFFSDEPLWLIVFHKMNATFIKTERTYTEYTEAFQNGIDIMPSIFHRIQSNDFRLYPLDVQPQVILVPEALPYSDFSAYLQTVLSNQFFDYFLLLMVGFVVLLTFFRYVKQKKFPFFESSIDVLNLFLNNNTSIKYQQLSRTESFLIVPLTFMGVIIVNGIFSNSLSYLTRPVYQPEINTIEDLYWSQLPILTWGLNGWKDELTEVFMKRTEFKDWGKNIIVVENAKLREYSRTFNRSMSFLTSLNNANTFVRAQKRLDIRGYHKTQIEVSSFPFSYPVNEKFVFFERLNEIVHRIQSAGLFREWIRQEYAQREKKILKANVKQSFDQDNSVTNFEFPMLIVYGWLTGSILLLIEIIWKKFKENRLRGDVTCSFVCYN